MMERQRMWIMVGIAVAVLAGAGLALLLIEGVNTWTLTSFAVLATVAILALVLVARTAKELRSGYPLEDERSRFMNMRAGYYAFYVSMYSVLGLAFVMTLLEDEGIVLANGELLFLVIVLMGSVHIVLSLYFKLRGKASLG